MENVVETLLSEKLDNWGSNLHDFKAEKELTVEITLSEYRDLIKSKYGFDISDKVVNYKINYCESFVPEYKYLSKSQRLEFADKLMTLDSNIYAKGIIDIDFKDRGIVEYFIDALLNEKISYNIKIRVSKDYEIRNRTINRLKRILL